MTPAARQAFVDKRKGAYTACGWFAFHISIIIE
jgi:hypothetical protein